MAQAGTLVAERRRQVAERTAARRGKPSATRRQIQRQPAARATAARRTIRQPLAPALGPPPVSYYVIATIVAVLTTLGLVMVLSASSVTSFHRGLSPWRYFSKQVMWSGLGAIALITTVRVPYQRWRTWVTPLLVACYLLMLLPFVPGLGVPVGGARAWVQLGPIGFQPSEFLKLAVLLYCADLLTKREDRMHLVRETLWPCLAVLVVSGMFMLAQGDLGSAIVLGALVLAVVFIGGTPLIPLAGVAGALGLTSLAFVMSTDYRRERWTAFLDLASTREKGGWQVWQSLVGIADGGITGVGVGASRAKWGYLPLAHSDFIFAIIAEELGLIGVVAVLGAFLLLAFFGIQIALAAADRFGMLLAGGITAWLIVQTIVNVGGVTGMMPLTGLTLPFLSFGGSSLLASMTAMGLLLNVARSSSPAT
ncbi:MAG: putative lipid II flippase FtsW [Acidimicrobiia bacterium]